MNVSPTNVVSATPDFLYGMSGGHPVLVPVSEGLGGRYSNSGGVTPAVYAGPWATRPLPASVPSGSEMLCTDFPAGGRSRWYSDGTSWRPESGRVKIGQASGTVASPVVNSVANAVAYNFWPGFLLTIPAGMIPPNSRISAQAQWARTTGTGASDVGLVLSTSAVATASLLSSHMLNFSLLGATVNLQSRSGGYIHFGASTTGFVANGQLVYDSQSAAAVLSVQTTLIDTAQPMYVAMSNDTQVNEVLSCVSYSIWLEA